MAGDADPGALPGEKIVEKAEPHLLEKLEPEQRELLLRVVERAVTSFEGPLPPPQMLAEYDRLIPGGAERLMKLVENQASHRQQQEARLVKAETSLSMRGQLIGTGLCLFFGLIGWHLSIHGHDGVAGLLFSTTILGLVTVFVLGRAPEAKAGDDRESEAETIDKRP
jgi:uncharacterized membrane protein